MLLYIYVLYTKTEKTESDKKSYSDIDSIWILCVLALKGSTDLCGLKVSRLLNLWSHQALLFAWMQLLLSSNSAGNLNGLSRPEWGQQDEVMNRHSLTWSRLKLRMKISCRSIVSTPRASHMIERIQRYTSTNSFSIKLFPLLPV